MPKPKARGKPAGPSPVRADARRWFLKCVLLLAAVGAFLAGLIWVGRQALEPLRGHDRYLVPVADIVCDPPPGLERGEFLEQVRYYSQLPERVPLLDDDLPARLRRAFAEHPWVASVDEVTITPPRQIEVRLTHRRPVLAVRWGDALRAVDAAGVLLPKTAPTQGLPVYPETPPPPKGREGTRWGDPNVEQAARKAR